jgi:ABC-type antimicrobial peptide transport system permease subunit
MTEIRSPILPRSTAIGAAMHDGPGLVLAAGGATLIVLLACIGTARRAGTLDPLESLRHD